MPFDPDLVDPGDPETKLIIRGGAGGGGRSGPGGPGAGGGFVGGTGGSFYGGGGAAYNPVSLYGGGKRRLGSNLSFGAPEGGVSSFGDAVRGGDGASLPDLSVTGERLGGRGGVQPLSAAPPPDEPTTPPGGTAPSTPASSQITAPDYAAIMRLPSAGGMAAAARQWAVSNGLGGTIGAWAQRDGWDTVNRALVEMIKNGTLHTQLPGMRDSAAGGDLNGADRNDAVGAVMRILQEALKSGVFSPNGSPALMDSLRAEGQRNANAIRQRTELRGRLSGADAGSAGTASLLADLEGSRAGSDLLNAQSVDRQNRYAQLVSGLLGSAYGQQAGQDNARFMSELQRILGEQSGNGDLLGLLGDLGGDALGALLGGLGRGRTPTPAPRSG